MDLFYFSFFSRIVVGIAREYEKNHLVSVLRALIYYSVCVWRYTENELDTHLREYRMRERGGVRESWSIKYEYVGKSGRNLLKTLILTNDTYLEPKLKAGARSFFESFTTEPVEQIERSVSQ